MKYCFGQSIRWLKWNPVLLMYHVAPKSVVLFLSI